MPGNQGHLTEEELKAKYNLWACTIRQFANKFVWQCVLFVNDSGQLEYGSPVQTRACQSVGIPNEYMEDFWNSEGRDAMEEAIRRKRNTLTNSMKQRFVQYCKKPDRDENEQPLQPPNPLKIIPLGVLRDITNLPETISVDGSDAGQGDQDSEEEGDENDRVARWVKEGLRDGAGVEEYKWFLLLFAECFSGGGSVSARSNESFKNLSDYMTVTVEAFAIVLYTNNYWKWTKLHWRDGDVSTISEASSRGKEGTLFTNEARGSSKYEGWSSGGYILYNRVFGVLEAQRRDPRGGKRFEESLRRMFQSRNNEKKRKRSTTVIAIRNGISELDRIMGVTATAV